MAKQPFENLVHHLFQIAARAEFKSLSDQDLLKRYVENRDDLAFGELVRRYKLMVWYVCWRVLGHHQDVEDAFQATVMTLVRGAKAILGRHTIEGWLHKVAYHVATKAKVMRARQHARAERRAKMWEESYESHESRRELSEILDKELTRIPEKYRSPLLLCYLEGLSGSEAAQRLGISLDSLKWRLDQGRKQLKKRLSKYGMELGDTMPLANLASGIQVPAVPHELVERTLDMVRIMTLANGALETAGVSPQVTVLIQSALGIWTMKMKIIMGALLLMLVGVGGGMAKYGGWLTFRTGQPPQRVVASDKKKVDSSKLSEKQSPQLDIHGDPLPPAALARIGTVRFRPYGGEGGGATFHPDGKTFVTVDRDQGITFWEIQTGKAIRRLEGSYSKVAISPDGTKLAVARFGGFQEKVQVWDLCADPLRKVWEQPVDNLRNLAFASGGKLLAVVCVRNDRGIDRNTLWLVAAATGDVQHKLSKLDNINMFNATLSPNGKILATSRGLWDTTTELKRPLKQRDKQGVCREVNHIVSMTFTPDGKVLAAIIYPDDPKEAAILSLWNTATGAEVREITRVQRHACFSLAFHPDGRTLIVADNCGRFHFWDVATGKESAASVTAEPIYPGFPCAFNGCEGTCFSPDGKLFLRWQGSVIGVWEVATGRLIGHSKKGIHWPVEDLAFSPDGKSLATWASPRELQHWEVETGRPKKPLEDSDKEYVLSPIYYTSDDGLIAWTNERQMVRWEVGTGKCSSSKPMPEEKGQLRALSVDGQYQLWGSMKGLVLVDRSSGKEIQKLPGPAKPMDWCTSFISLSADGETVLVHDIHDKNMVKVWSVKQARPIMSLDGKFVNGRRGITANYRWHKKVSSVALSPDRRWLAAVQLGPEPAIRLWEVASGHESMPNINLPKGASIEFLVWSPNERFLAGGDAEGTVWLWDMVSMQEVHRFTGHRGAVATLAFSPDGFRIASGSKDTTVLVWDLRSLSLRRTKTAKPWSAEELWAALGKVGIGTGDMLVAMDELVRHPEVALPLLRQRLQISPPPDLNRVAKLLAQLDDNEFKVRKQAALELEKMDERIAPKLHEALAKKPSPEVSRRIENALEKIEERRTLKQLQVLRSVEVLERIGTPEARHLLEEFAKGKEGVRAVEAQAALQRLAKRRTVPVPR